MSAVENQGMPPAPDLEALALRLLATVREVADELRPQAKLGNAQVFCPADT